MSTWCSRLSLLVASGALLALSACTDVSRGTVDSMRLAWRGQPKLAPTAQEVSAKPFYQMRATTAKGDAVLILGNVDGRRQFWYGNDGGVVVLQDGHVVQTIGLAQNLDGSRVADAHDPFRIGLQNLRSPQTYARQDDWSPGYRYGVHVDATLTPSGSTDIDILGTSHHVLLVTEKTTAKATGYNASSRYWVDPADGFIWMSEQQVMPGLTLKLVQLRPYRGATP
jgi:hypothetical protein